MKKATSEEAKKEEDPEKDTLFIDPIVSKLPNVIERRQK